MREVDDAGSRKGARVFSWWIAILGAIAAMMPIVLREFDALAWAGVVAGVAVAGAGAFASTGRHVTTGRTGAASLVAALGGAYILVHPYFMDAALAYRYGLTVVGLMLLALSGMDLWTARHARTHRVRASHR
ncbi:MAG TPA: hypothetical protein VFH78_13360 [Candidatus Thermoplasmatota archaeon]|nr:hypothetical protein [Candidatus Thermoplasmatota archaeon]